MKHFDKGSIIVIVITFILFTAALFAKGLTHDLLLEGGVFLVSVKLIMVAYKNKLNYMDVKKDLTEIKELLEKGRVKK